MNLLLFKVLASLGFQVTMSEKSYLVPLLFSFIVLYMINKKLKKVRNINHYIF